MTSNLIWFSVAAFVLLPLIVWNLWWTWRSTAAAFLGGLGYVCAVLAAFIMPQLWSAPIWLGTKCLISCFVFMGMAFVVFLAYILVHESSAWFRARVHNERKVYSVAGPGNPLYRKEASDGHGMVPK